MLDFAPYPIAKTYAPATAEEAAAFSSLGEQLAARCRKAHPYLHADEGIFSILRAAYTGAQHPLHATVRAYVERVTPILQRPAYALNDAADGLQVPLTNPHPDGFDAGGRLGVNDHTEHMLHLALAYRLTEDARYARLCYFIGRDMVRWEHWCEGHFLNCADGAYPVAVSYDWLCDAWQCMGLDPTVIAVGLYDRAITPGYDSVMYDTCAHPSRRQMGGWRFKCKPDNWNAVCNGGLIACCLSLLCDRAILGEERYAHVITLLGGCVTSLSQPALVLHQYVPDGSYVESNSYWAYGTGRLFTALGALYTALGTDLGLHRSEGLDKTCYYALNTESAEYVGWNYHDGGLAPQTTSIFPVYATVSGDHRLFSIRSEQLARGKELTPYDLLYHPAVRGITPPPMEHMPLDHHMAGIDGFTVRNGWKRGSLFTAILGGENPVGSSHSQLDCGTFVYHNGTHMWLCDLGVDNYNLKEGYFNNYALYRRNAEGNNTLCLSSLPFGQAFGATGRIVRHTENTESPFAVIDTTEAYAPYAVYARRGLRVQDGRRTTILRDEVCFTEAQDAFWTANVDTTDIQVRIEEGGRRCTLTHTDGTQLLLRLYTDIDAHFELTDTYTPLLSGTKSFEGEKDRSTIARLVIRLQGVREASLSVVMTLAADEQPYTPQPMAMW